jgi:hypothetical protein
MHTIDSAVPVTPALAVSRGADKTITIHTLGTDGLEQVGTFANIRDAWAAVDALDLQDDVELAA